MIDPTTTDSIVEATALASDGAEIGTVKGFHGEDDGRPVFAAITTGDSGTTDSFVPVHNAEFDGEHLRLGYDRDTVLGAPRLEPDGELSLDQRVALYGYYQLDVTGDHVTDKDPDWNPQRDEATPSAYRETTEDEASERAGTDS